MGRSRRMFLCLLKKQVERLPRRNTMDYSPSSVEFWLGLQADYETAITRGTIEKALEAIRPYQPAA